MEATTIQDMKSMVIDFWDDYDCPAPSAATRRLKLISIYCQRPEKMQTTINFTFMLDAKITIIGKFARLLFLFFSVYLITHAPVKLLVSGSESRSTSKRERISPALNTIMRAKRSYSRRKISLISFKVQAHLSNILRGSLAILFRDIYVAPFVDIKAFWEEYCAFHTLQHTPSSNVAGITTFRQAYKFCEGLGIRKLKSKGTFNTCEICNNASDLLRNTSKKKYIIYFAKF